MTSIHSEMFISNHLVIRFYKRPQLRSCFFFFSSGHIQQFSCIFFSCSFVSWTKHKEPFLLATIKCIHLELVPIPAANGDVRIHREWFASHDHTERQTAIQWPLGDGLLLPLTWLHANIDRFYTSAEIWYCLSSEITFAQHLHCKVISTHCLTN